MLDLISKGGTLIRYYELECELPDKLAGLDIVGPCPSAPAAGPAPAPAAPAARVLRQRKPGAEEAGPSNRRVERKPRKRTAAEISSAGDIEALYLNKKAKAPSQNLETIAEEATAATLVGGRKLRRLLAFQLGSRYTKEKIKKRRSKIKKFLGNKSFLNRKKIPMHVFLETIRCLDLDEEPQEPEVCARVIPE